MTGYLLAVRRTVPCRCLHVFLPYSVGEVWVAQSCYQLNDRGGSSVWVSIQGVSSDNSPSNTKAKTV
jgi:hypothetical protein